MKSVTNRYRQNFRPLRAGKPAPLTALARSDNSIREASMKKYRSRHGGYVKPPVDQDSGDSTA